MKRIIKRYPNRKLYDTRESRFVNLDSIASLVRQGEEIQVEDNATGADITVHILEQIIYQQESRQWRSIPEYGRVLRDSIRMGGDVMSGFLRKVILSGLGAFLLTKESVEKLVEELIRRGEISREDAPGFLQELRARTEENSRKLESEIRQRAEKAVRAIFPDLSRLDELAARVDALAVEVEALKKPRSAPPAGGRRRSAARKKAPGADQEGGSPSS